MPLPIDGRYYEFDPAEIALYLKGKYNFSESDWNSMSTEEHIKWIEEYVAVHPDHIREISKENAYLKMAYKD